MESAWKRIFIRDNFRDRSVHGGVSIVDSYSTDNFGRILNKNWLEYLLETAFPIFQVENKSKN